MTQKEYREDEAISRSELFPILRESPQKMKYAMDNPEEKESLALLEGRAAHKEVLEPDTFVDEFTVAPQCDRRTKEGKEIYARFLTEAEGKDVLTEESYQKIKDMAAALKTNPLAVKFLKGEHEKSFFWVDPDTGEKCKVRPDCIAEVDGKKYIVDYKTTDSCADGSFESSVRKFGYKFQAGMYREGVFQNTFEEYGFAFVAQEKKAPYVSRVYICNEDFIQEGYEQFRTAITKYHWCKENNNFYGYEGPDNEPSELYGEGEY
ncbi:MAG: PD-(D/E)XK nuclease-like domain-containing protein [Clostridiales bacterium]|nr:PD-(D/E)XK nuclease-like domain-containing protein [Clostridiales bacterium]MBQ1575134.1 PD-(D/E)XK nuclease-like domain-containing protein [Clostridiales bacterium]